MLFFTWLRTAVRNAVLSGVQDALERLDQAAGEQPQEDVTVRLSVTVTPAEKRLKGGRQPT
jgi:hypothetical protein